MPDELLLDGFGPLPVRRPATPAELGDIVREAAAAGHAVYPVGGGTRLDVGLTPTKPGVAVSLRGLAGVIDYPARDMTVTVRAGTTAAELRAVLAAEGQRLPVDRPSADRGTVGGAVAANLSGPRRFGSGTLRDYVIGIGFVADDGSEVKGGGQVVKNVAGYDLMKLHTGALGTLGVVTQVTLKVFPKPDAQALVAFGVAAAAVGPTLDRLHASAARPVAVELLSADAVRRVAAAAGVGLPEFEPWVIVAGFEEKRTTVAAQVDALKAELKAAPVRDLTDYRGPACDPLWAALTDLPDDPASAYIWKASVRPSRVAEFVREVTITPGAVVHAHALSGIVWVHAAADGFVVPEPRLGQDVRLEKAASAAGGRVVVRRAPADRKGSLHVWGGPTAERELMRTVKRTLDPNDVFNPGRLFPG